MRLKKDIKFDNLIDRLVDSNLNIGSSKKFWNPKIKPYLSKVSKKTCVFDLIKLLNLLKQSSQALSFRILSKEKIIIVESPKGWELSYKYLGEKNSFVLFFSDSKKIRKSNGFLLSGQGIKKELEKEVKALDFPSLFSVGSSNKVEGVDYPLFGNYSSFEGNSFPYFLLKAMVRRKQMQIKVINTKK